MLINYRNFFNIAVVMKEVQYYFNLSSLIQV